nr:hypothetical protein [Aeromonas enteropelogenes]
MLSFIGQFVDQQWLYELLGVDNGFSLIGCVEAGCSNRGISNPIDSDEATITTGSRNTTDPSTTRSRCSTGS